MTRDEVFALFEAQGYSCAVCGTTDAGSAKGWSVDHDHKDGHVRGILCHACNLAANKMMTPAVLRAVADYLER